MATPASIPVNAQRDTVARLHRITRGNRSLWYQMTVLQQPERARARGSGMKGMCDFRSRQNDSGQSLALLTFHSQQ